MIVTCEKCQSKFKLAEAEINNISAKGRILKCGNCHHMWLATKEMLGFGISALSNQPSDKKLIENLKTQPRSTITLMDIVADDPIDDYFKLTSLPIFLKIVVYSLVFFLSFSLLITQKDYIYDHLKPAKVLLALMGVKDNRGLEFEKIKIVKSSLTSKVKPLIISGYVVNNSDQNRSVPDLRIQFFDQNGEMIKVITHNLPKKILEPTEKAKISNRIINYPRDAEYIILDIGNYMEFLFR